MYHGMHHQWWSTIHYDIYTMWYTMQAVHFACSRSEEALKFSQRRRISHEKRCWQRERCRPRNIGRPICVNGTVSNSLMLILKTFNVAEERSNRAQKERKSGKTVYNVWTHQFKSMAALLEFNLDGSLCPRDNCK